MDNRERKIEQYKALIKAFADPCEGVVYHYTSAQGLRGIIENNEIWLTNTEFVNDTTECKALQNEKDLFSRNELENGYVKEHWCRFIKRPDASNDTYIASFSRGKESLDQWRAYGNFRIGFHVKKLAKRHFFLYECLYHKQKIKDWILQKERVKEWEGNCLDDQFKRVAAFNLMYTAQMKYKNESYANEQEVRLIVVSNHKWDDYDCPSMYEDDPPIHFRDHPVLKTPVPYAKFFIEKEKEQENNHVEEPLRETERQMKERKLKEEKEVRRERLPIKEILIGPMLNQEEAKIACDILLCEKGYENVKVTASDIPYRGF